MYEMDPNAKRRVRNELDLKGKSALSKIASTGCTVQLYIAAATLQICLLQCPYLSTKVTSPLRSLWPSPMGDRYRGVRLYCRDINVCVFDMFQV